jgi:hypothetical protein
MAENQKSRRGEIIIGGQRKYSCTARRCWKEGCKSTFTTWKAMRRHDHYMFRKILFEKKFVLIRLRQFGYKQMKLPANQLVRHFTQAEIRRAIARVMKKKYKLKRVV